MGCMLELKQAKRAILKLVILQAQSHFKGFKCQQIEYKPMFTTSTYF